MWKKTYIRFMFLVMIIAGALVVTSATRSANKKGTECSDGKEQCCEKRNQGEFIIWESLSRTIMATVQE